MRSESAFSQPWTSDDALVSDKAQRTAESRMLAIGDLLDVMHIAGVLRRNPPDRQVALLSGGEAYDDPCLPRMLETGLAVTYARVFTKGDRYSPVPPEWVPAENADLHEELMERRHRYHAHIDRAPANPHRREAGDAGDGWFALGFPDGLTPAQLDELVDLAEKLRVRVDVEFR